MHWDQDLKPVGETEQRHERGDKHILHPFLLLSIFIKFAVGCEMKYEGKEGGGRRAGGREDTQKTKKEEGNKIFMFAIIS